MAFCISTFCFSQSDFRKGFIIIRSDTLNGLVEYKDGAEAYKSCTFTKGKGESAKSYTPNEIRGYGFTDGKYFESKQVKEENQDPKVVFVEVKVNGRVSLYKYHSSFFVAKTGDTLSRLYNKVELRRIDGKQVEWNGNQHIVTLNWLLFDCAALRERIQKTQLYDRELTSLIKDYNECTGAPAVTPNESKPWIKLGVGITAGLQISQLRFSPTSFNFRHLEGSFDVSTSPEIGFSFDMLWPRISERFSFHADLLYIHSRYEKISTFPNYYSTETNYVTIDLHQLKIPIGVRYAFPGRKISPYVNMGISGTLNFDKSSTWVMENQGHFNDVFLREDMGEALAISSIQYGVWGGLGIRKTITPNLRIFLDVRYEQMNGFPESSYPNERLRTQVRNFQITIGIER